MDKILILEYLQEYNRHTTVGCSRGYEQPCIFNISIAEPEMPPTLTWGQPRSLEQLQRRSNDFQ